MRKIIPMAFGSAVASVFTSIMVGVPFWYAALYAGLALTVSLLLFSAGEYFANTRYRPLIDVQYLQRGVCPCCKATGGLVEVTSDRDAERIVVCAPCTNAFALVLDRGRVAANRLGEKPGYLQ